MVCVLLDFLILNGWIFRDGGKGGRIFWGGRLIGGGEDEIWGSEEVGEEGEEEKCEI